MSVTENILKSYEKRNEERAQFREIAKKNLSDVEKCIEECDGKCSRIENTIENVKELSKHPQARSYVKICSLAYVNALVKHTGEYNVVLSSDYQCTMTKDQTIEYLEEQLAEQKGILSTYATQKEQLEKRLGYVHDEVENDTSEMPEKIISDRGVAFKQGGFYEIVEETDEPYVKCKKRISRVKNLSNGTERIEKLKIIDDIKNLNDKAEAFLDLIEK